jgi:hypothetical protein
MLFLARLVLKLSVTELAKIAAINYLTHPVVQF